MSSVLRRLVTVLGFRVNKTGLGDYEKSINSLRKNVFQLQLSFNSLKFAARGALFGNVVTSAVGLSVAKTANGLNDLSKKTGLSIQSLQALDLMSLKLGNSAGEVTKTFSGLSAQISKIQNPIQRLTTLQNLAIEKNKNLRSVFNQTGEAFQKQEREARVLTSFFSEQDLANSKKYIESWGEFRTILDNIRTDIGKSYMPAFNSLTSSFKNWYLENRMFIKQLSGALTSGLSFGLEIVGKSVNNLIGPITKLFSFFAESPLFLKKASEGIQILGTSFSYLYPLLLPVSRTLKVILLSITAISKVIEDFKGWSSGMQSVFGEFFGSFDLYAEKLQSLKKTFWLPSYLEDLRRQKAQDEEKILKREQVVLTDEEWDARNPLEDWLDFIGSKKEQFLPSFNLNPAPGLESNKNVVVNPTFSFKIDNINLSSNSKEEAKKAAENIVSIVRKEIDFSFSELVNNLKL